MRRRSDGKESRGSSPGGGARRSDGRKACERSPGGKAKHSDGRAAKVAISGYYGYDNCGDEAVLLAIIESLRKLKPDIRIVVLSGNPEKTRELYNVEAIGRWNPLSVLFAILSCRLLISGGGSLLQDVTSSLSLRYYLTIIRLAAIFGKRVMIYCQGMGPLLGAKNRKRVAKALDRCDIVSVRDSSSANLLAEIGIKREVHVFCDPVLAIGVSHTAGSARDGGDFAADSGATSETVGAGRDLPLLVAVMRHWRNNEHITQVAAYLDLYIEHGWDVLLVPAHYSEDAKALLEISALMKNTPRFIDKSLTAKEFIETISNADMVLSMRLHGLICAYAIGIPIIGISYDPKVSAFMEQVGLSDFCFRYDQFNSEIYETHTAAIDAIAQHVGAQHVGAQHVGAQNIDERQIGEQFVNVPQHDEQRQEMRALVMAAAQEAITLLK